MILLVDGYNLLKSITGSLQISENQRFDFIKKLNNYSKIKRHKIIIVFDGGTFSYPTREQFENIYIVYSGYNYSADDIIKNYLSDNRNYDILLITSDLELRKFALSLSIESISSHEFDVFLNNAFKILIKKVDEGLYKTSKDSSEELDQLMSEASKQILKKDEDEKIDRKNKLNELSKKEKRISQKLRKL